MGEELKIHNSLTICVDLRNLRFELQGLGFYAVESRRQVHGLSRSRRHPVFSLVN